MLSTFDFILQLPEFFLVFSFFYILLFFVHPFFNKQEKNLFFFKLPNFCTLLIFFFSFGLILNTPAKEVITFFDMITINELLFFFKFILILFSCCFLVVCTKNFITNFYITSEFFCFFILSFLGSLLLFSTNNLIIIYLGIELQSLSFYSLTCYKRNFTSFSESGIKYFIFGAFSSGLILFGFSLFYGLFGTLNLIDINKLLIVSFYSKKIIYSFFAIGLITVGIGFKIVAAPFHFWAIEVYDNIYTPVAFWFSFIGKLSILFFLFKFYYLVFFSIQVSTKVLFSFIAFFCYFFGTLSVINQRKLKRFFIISSLTHTGFILSIFSVFSKSSIIAFLFYIFGYMIITINIWIFIMAVNPKYCYNKFFIQNLNQLKYQNYWFICFTTILLFSLAGLPPLVGFSVKFISFLTLLENKFYFLAISALIAAIVSSFYYINFIKKLWFFNFDKQRFCLSNFFYRNCFSKLTSIVFCFNTIFFIFCFLVKKDLFLIFFFIIRFFLA